MIEAAFTSNLVLDKIVDVDESLSSGAHGTSVDTGC